MGNKTTTDNFELNEALRAFESQALSYASSFVNDAKVRSAYIEEVKDFSKSTMEAYRSGKLTAKQAQDAAHEMRGQIMELARARTSSMGRSVALMLKEKNIPLEELIARYARERFGRPPQQLSAAELDVVALDVVAAAGRTSSKVNNAMRGLGRAGRAFWVLTALIALYNIGTAQNKTVAAGREGANIGGGFAGGALGGAAVGAVVTGPLAPVGAAIGAVIGGILGAVVADEAYVEGVVPLSSTLATILPRFTHMFSRDEEGLANALFDECGINIDQVCEVVNHLNEYYSTDADDVVYYYVEIVRKHGGSVQQAIKLHPTARQLLIDSLESGWTDSDESQAIAFLKSI